MKKIILSSTLVLIFAAYVLYRHTGTNEYLLTQPSSSTAVDNRRFGQQTEANARPSSNNQSPKKSTPPKQSASSMYKDGSYTGDVADAYYGNVQVVAVIQGGQLADVQFLDYPHDRSTSREINSQATPMLRQEAIQAQSAQIDAVSGATATSEAFIQSLASALAQAKN